MLLPKAESNKNKIVKKYRAYVRKKKKNIKMQHNSLYSIYIRVV